LVLLLVACGSNEDNRVGLGFIEDLGELKAVRDTTFAPPDTSIDFHVTDPPSSIGTSATLLFGARTGYLASTFVKWDIAVLPDSGTAIDSAVVKLVAQADQPAADPPAVLTVHRITTDWNENELVRDTIPEFLPDPSDTVTFSGMARGDTASFKISLAQFWTDHPDSNFGMVMLPVDGTQSLLEFGSQESNLRPTLTVIWGAPTDTVVILAPSDDTFTLEATPEFVPLTGMPGRMTVARGIAARSLMYFTLPGPGEVPGFSEFSTVNRAELILRVDQTASLVDSVAVGVQRVLSRPWQGDSTEVSSVLFGATAVEAESDSVVLAITLLVQDVLRNENHGFQLRALDERPDADYIRFHGYDSEAPEKAPILRVWYTPGDVEATAP
jgi:hypothetical protein